MLEAPRLAEFARDETEVRDGSFVAFGCPFLEDVRGAAFREPEPENSAPKIVFLAIFINLFFVVRSTRLVEKNFGS